MRLLPSYGLLQVGVFICGLACGFVDYGSGEDDYLGDFGFCNVYAGSCIA